MKRIIIYALSIVFLYSGTVTAALTEKTDTEKIAVVKSKFDNIEKILQAYGVPHSIIRYSDLEADETLSKFNTIFFPCGIDNPIETNINILSRGTSIQAVSLKDDYVEIDINRVYKNISSFIKNGGNAYFSDFSYNFPSNAFNNFNFFDDFPNMGMPGTIRVELLGDLAVFCGEKSQRLFMPHPGWVVVKSIADSETLATGIFETIKGDKSGPIVSLIKKGKGEAIYTSYHSSSSNNILRYIIYRLSYRHLLDDLLATASRWEQEINCSIIDSIRPWESSRAYILPLKEGSNSVYFKSNKGFYQIDILNKNLELMLSADMRENNLNLSIDSDEDELYIIKIYQSLPELNGIYSIVSAGGMRILPFYKRGLCLILITLLLFFLYWFKTNFISRKFSGLLKQK